MKPRSVRTQRAMSASGAGGLMTMTDGSPRFATPPRLSSRTDDDPAIEPSLQCLRSLRLAMSTATIDEPSKLAERLTLESQAFILDILAWRGDKNASAGDTRVARIDPSASAMLGWGEKKSGTQDEFASRLMTAFECGALDVRLRPIDDHPVLAQAAAPSFSDDRKRPLSRVAAAVRSDRQHQRYAAPGMAGRPLYTPW